MLSEIPLNFFNFSFIECLATEDMFYDWSFFDNTFREGIQSFQNPNSDTSMGPLLTLNQLDKTINSPNDCEGKVLLQIIHMMPLKMKLLQDDSFVLHEMVVVAWVSDSCTSQTVEGVEAYRFKRLNHDKLLVVLDSALTKSVIHCYRKRHLGLFMEQDLFKLLLENSKILEVSLDRLINDCGVEVYVGLTSQQAIVNCMMYHKANRLLHSVFHQIGFADVSYDTDTIDLLSSHKLIPTKDIELVFE